MGTLGVAATVWPFLGRKKAPPQSIVGNIRV